MVLAGDFYGRAARFRNVLPFSGKYHVLPFSGKYRPPLLGEVPVTTKEETVGIGLVFTKVLQKGVRSSV